MNIIFATKNKGKIREIKKILGDQFEIMTMEDANVNMEIEETGKTFEENAKIKAKAVYDVTRQMTVSDDSGLEVDYLHKKPGVYSARFAKEDTPYDIKNQAIIDLLRDVPFEERTARFVCAIAICFENGEIVTVKDTIEGYIGYEIKGENGFGYDPIFYLPEYQKTTAELDLDVKNKISHRGKALLLAKDIIYKKLRI